MKKYWIYIIIVVVVLLIIAAVWYFNKKKKDDAIKDNPVTADLPPVEKSKIPEGIGFLVKKTDWENYLERLAIDKVKRGKIALTPEQKTELENTLKSWEDLRKKDPKLGVDGGYSFFIFANEKTFFPNGRKPYEQATDEDLYNAAVALGKL